MMTVVLWVLFLLGVLLSCTGYWAFWWAERELVDREPDFNLSYGEGVGAGVLVAGLAILAWWIVMLIAWHVFG